MARDRAVHPDCPNAPNPFHICADYCSHGPVPRSNVPDKKEILVSNGENGAMGHGGRRRIVDPLSVSATNPPLKGDEMMENSQEHLPRSNTPANKEILVSNGENGAIGHGGRRRIVDPLSVSATNPPLKGDEMMENSQEYLPRSNRPANKEILVSNGENGAIGQGGRRRIVDPLSVSATNPPLNGDELMENSQEHLPRSNTPANKEILVSNGVGSKENGAIGQGGRRGVVDPLSVNASNPPLKGDEMMENSQEHLRRSNTPANKEILVSNGVGSKENGAIGQGGRRGIVDPLSVNASNPPLKGDEMMENSQEHLPRSNTPANKEILVLNGVRSKENGEKVEGGRRRSVDPLCVNASNPFHQCADYCIRRNQDGKSPLNGSYKFGGTKEKEVITDKRKVNSNCTNASNPFHQCADYCSARSFGVEKHKQGNAGESSSKGGLIVAQRKDVNPGCVNASNPFHKCTENCSQTRRN